MSSVVHVVSCRPAMNESFVSIYLAWHGTDSSKTMSLFNFGFSSKKKNDKGEKENVHVEDRPSSDIQSENVDQAPAAPGDVATGSGASASGDPGPRGPVRDERVWRRDGDPIITPSLQRPYITQLGLHGPSCPDF